MTSGQSAGAREAERDALEPTILVAARAIAVAVAVLSAAPATAQMSMPGMEVPKEPKKPLKKIVPKEKVAKHSAVPKDNVRKPRAPTSMPGDDRTMHMPVQPPAGTTSIPMAAPPQSMGEMTMPTGQTAASNMPVQHGSHEMGMTGAYGSYTGQRESSGTAWKPDASAAMGGPTLMSGKWMLMAHGTLNLVYDDQSGVRGDDKAFASGMLMAMARHPLGNGTLQFRTMLSPDPTMGPTGYPLLLASGETANGRTPLIDRQHPHDFVMELSASISQSIGKASVFLYGGLPGEPAFGPPAFMHRESILDSPEAPITHHWLDSTHITFGVVTAGVVLDRMKIEVSQFNAREPDQHRWNIETGKFDSTSLRLSWNPTRTVALQGSWGRFKEPEELEPGVNQTRWSASALWADDVAPDWHGAVTLAWGRKSSDGHNDDAAAAEASMRHAGWTAFGRGEWTQNRELLGASDSPAYEVGKISLGAVRDFRIADHSWFGAGGLFSVNFVPDALAARYGSHNPTGMMGFVRLKLD